MASYSTKFLGKTVYAYLRQEMRRRTKGLEERPHGVFLIDTGTLTFDGSAVLNDAGDEYELLEFPSNVKVYLLDFAIEHSDWDSNVAPELTIDLIIQTAAGAETVLVNECALFQGTTALTPVAAHGEDTLLVSAWKPTYDVTGCKVILETGTDALTDVTSNTVRGKFVVYVCGVASTLTGA